MLSLISIIYASLSTIRQTDLKRIIAYSSIAHMGIANLSIFTFTKLGISASVILQLAHGLVSSALFILVTILYNHHHTRAIIYFRGMSLTMPLFSSLFVFFNLCNIGMPLTGNFIGEFLSILAGFQYSPIVAIIASISIVLSACYALYLVARICYGESSPYIELSRDLNRKEFYSLLVLTILILLIGIFPNVLIYLINSGLRDVLTNFK
jgi:NADH:ubiquinone oxidoreductase subunit 4 (subunit M)